MDVVTATSATANILAIELTHRGGVAIGWGGTGSHEGIHEGLIDGRDINRCPTKMG